MGKSEVEETVEGRGRPEGGKREKRNVGGRMIGRWKRKRARRARSREMPGENCPQKRTLSIAAGLRMSAV